MSGSLKGLRVLDFTQVAAGPTCTMMLADRGAEVIKIEPPTGDLARQLGPPWLAGESVIYMALNRNKLGMMLDLKQPGDRDEALRLVRECDILVESFRPGVMAKLGLDYATLSVIKPDLIYCSISAYGQTGADRDKPGVDGIIQAVSGLMSTTGEADGEPVKIQTPVVDMTTGFLATLAIFEALRERERDGQGRWLDISMYGCALQLQQTAVASYLTSGELPRRTGSAAPYSAPNEAYPTQDGWIMVAAYQQSRWYAFCHAVGLPQLIDDARFSDSPARVRHRRELTKLLAPVLTGKTTAQWCAVLNTADVICAPVADYRELSTTDQFVRSGMTMAIEQPGVGRVTAVSPTRLGQPCTGAPSVTAPAPRLGEHTEAIRARLKVMA